MDAPTTPLTPFLTPKQFMAATNLPRNTVYQGLSDGSIPSIRISKRKILIPANALERRLAESGHPAAEDQNA